MLIFFDTEFTGLNTMKDTDLVSIGLVSSSGETFYAELTDYREELCDDWVKENVINNLFMNTSDRHVQTNNYHSGDKKVIANALKEWFNTFGEDKIQLVSDCCHYDMMLFTDLFGGAALMPANINPCCYDICQDIAAYLYKTRLLYNAPDPRRWNEAASSYMFRAFDSSREEFLDHMIKVTGVGSIDMVGLGKEPMKHNSLYDAKVIRAVYTLLGVYNKMR